MPVIVRPTRSDWTYAVADRVRERGVLPALAGERHDHHVAERADAVARRALLGGGEVVERSGGMLPGERRLQAMPQQDPRPVAIELVESELDRLRRLGPDAVRSLVPASPVEREAQGIVVATRIQSEGERLLVLVDARRGRRMLATGGFAMAPDGSTHTPH